MRRDSGQSLAARRLSSYTESDLAKRRAQRNVGGHQNGNESFGEDVADRGRSSLARYCSFDYQGKFEVSFRSFII